MILDLDQTPAKVMVILLINSLFYEHDLLKVKYNNRSQRCV